MGREKKKKKGRRPAHQNEIKFYHNPHSVKTAYIMSIKHVGLCHRCAQIIEWRKTYRKYKPLQQPRKCDNCAQKTIRRAYHTVCDNCAYEKGICPKCKAPAESANEIAAITEGYAMKRLDGAALKEREKRSIRRHIDQGYLSDPEQIVQVIEDLEAGKVIDWEELRRQAILASEEDEEGIDAAGSKKEGKKASVHEKKTNLEDENGEFSDDMYDDFDMDEDEDFDYYDYDSEGDDDEEKIEAEALSAMKAKHSSKASKEGPEAEVVAGVPVDLLAVPVNELRPVKPKDDSKEAQAEALAKLMAQLGPEGVAAALRAMNAEMSGKSKKQIDASAASTKASDKKSQSGKPKKK